MTILFPSLKDYIKSHQDLSGARRNLRLNTRIPVLYAFQEKSGKAPLEYRQSYTTDISQGGLAIKVIDPPQNIQKKLFRIDQDMLLKIDIPGQEDLIKFTGRIQWHKTLHAKSPARHMIGIRFEDIRADDRIDVLAYAIRQVNRRRVLRAFVVLLITGILVTGTWAVQSTLSRKAVKKQLIISEKARQNLEQEVKLLDEKRGRLEDLLSANTRKIQDQDLMLNKQKKIIKEMSLYIDHSKYLLEDIYKEWNIDTLSDFLIFDNLYKQGQQALKEKKYGQAVQSLDELVKKYPDALLGYRLLIMALYGDGKKEEADRLFQDYTQKIKAQVISPK